MNNKILIKLIPLVFTILFMYSGISKLIDNESLITQLKDSPMPKNWVGWMVWAVPLTEISISIMLQLTPFRITALYASFGLMLLFTGYIIILWNYGHNLPCSCGGVLEQLPQIGHLIFNAFFSIFALVGILLEKRFRKESAGKEIIATHN